MILGLEKVDAQDSRQPKERAKKKPRETGMPTLYMDCRRGDLPPRSATVSNSQSCGSAWGQSSGRRAPILKRQNELKIIGTKICASETEAEGRPRHEAWSCARKGSD